MPGHGGNRTSDLWNARAALRNQITPDKTPALECRIVGSWMQFHRALHSFKEKWQQNFYRLI